MHAGTKWRYHMTPPLFTLPPLSLVGGILPVLLQHVSTVLLQVGDLMTDSLENWELILLGKWTICLFVVCLRDDSFQWKT